MNLGLVHESVRLIQASRVGESTCSYRLVENCMTDGYWEQVRQPSSVRDQCWEELVLIQSSH